MLSDVKLGHFEVITPQQYNGYPWWQNKVSNPFTTQMTI